MASMASGTAARIARVSQSAPRGEMSRVSYPLDPRALVLPMRQRLLEVRVTHGQQRLPPEPAEKRREPQPAQRQRQKHRQSDDPATRSLEGRDDQEAHVHEAKQDREQGDAREDPRVALGAARQQQDEG